MSINSIGDSSRYYFEMHHSDSMSTNAAWDASNIAEILWRNPYAQIDPVMVDKVNVVSEYLDEIGFELVGTSADGDCFFHAFLEGYQCLTKCKRADLDTAINKVSYLRRLVAKELQTVSKKSLEETQKESARIGKSGEWVIADYEGRLLAQALNIPIRLLSVDTAHDRSGVKTFLIPAMRQEEISEWNNLEDVPEEYVFIVDLGGHFVCAKESLNRDELETPSPSTLRMETIMQEMEKDTQRLSLDDKDISLEALVLLGDEDATPLHSFSIREVAMSDDNGNLIFMHREEDLRRFHTRLCSILEELPAMLLELTKSPYLHKNVAIEYGYQALEKLLESAKADIEIVQDKLNKAEGATEEELQALLEKKWHLDKQFEETQEERKKLLRLKNSLTSQLFQMSIEASFAESEDSRVEQLFKIFEDLREISPTSLVPFYMMLTILTPRLKEEDLTSLMEMAKECDPYVTYSLIVSFQKTMFGVTSMPRGSCLLYTTENRNELARHALKALQKVYPRDLAIPLLFASLDRGNGVERDFSPVDTCLEEALTSLSVKKTKKAIHTLVKHKPFITGHSIIHRYLALAWALEGDFYQARRINKRASLMLTPDGTISSEMMNLINSFLSKGLRLKSADKPFIEQNSPYQSFIEMLQNKTLDVSLVRVFVENMKDTLSSDLQELPLLYFGMEKIASRLVIGEDFEYYRPLFESLFELLTVVACTCFKDEENLDPWVEENFTLHREGDKFRFGINFSQPLLGPPLKKKTPIFKFSKALVLTDESIQSLATYTLKQIYSLIFSLMVSSTISRCYEEHNIQSPPMDLPILASLLERGFASKLQKYGHRSRLFDLCVETLKNYRANTANDALNPKLLEWSKFCIFSTEPPLLSPDGLRQEIQDLFYPANFSHEKYQKTLRVAKKIEGVFLPKGEKTGSLLLELATRDILLAHHRLAMRSSASAQIIDISKDDNVFTLFQKAQQLYGWRLGESFHQWGKRLKEAEKEGPIISDFRMVDQVNPELLQAASVDEEVIQIDLSVKVRSILKGFLQFWIKFQKMTEAKNKHIAEGGDEDRPGSKVVNWHHGVKDWDSIIIHNKPQDYPGFKKLSVAKREELQKLVEKKHAHVEEVSTLKKIHGELKKEDVSVCDDALATLLIAASEYSRDEAHHSLFVESEEHARLIFQVLLEISSERMLRSALVEGKVNNWMGDSADNISERLQKNLNELIGTFHGPEIHLSGTAPMQMHYNAGIVTSNLSVINAHIYFKESTMSKGKRK